MSTALRAVTGGTPLLADVGLLIGRLVVGLVFVAHGLQKFDQGLGATGEGFDQMGLPAPSASATFQAILEVAGGALLVVGALTPLVGVLLAASMVVAAVLVHSDAFYVSDGGWEFVGVLAAASLMLALTGPGRYSVDALLGRRAQKTPAEG